MNTRAAAWLAWSIWAVAIVGVALSLLADLTSETLNVSEVMFGLGFLLFPTVGALIASRRPENPIGWIFCAVALAIFGQVAEQYAVYALVTRPGSLPGGEWMAWLSAWVGNPGFYLVFTFTLLLFPNGRLLSPRWRPVAWLAAGWIILNALGLAFAPGPMSARIPSVNNPLGIEALPGLAAFLGDLEAPVIVPLAILSAASLILRFRRAQAEERQQLKWFAYAATLLLVTAVFFSVFDYFVPETPVRRAVGDTVFAFTLALMPISIGFAILKYRLFDIDLLIQRTLVYAALSGLLTVAYFSSVVLLENFARALTGQAQSQIVTVVSTLAIAALFTPLRRRIQNVIDRRFYRRKYDAAQTLAAFSAAARDEVELDQLAERLTAVVEETMQPASLSLWLKKPTHAVSREDLR